MVVDCHTHIKDAGDDAEVSGHLAAAETVDKCFVLPLPGASSALINNNLSGYVCSYADRMVGFAFVDPTRDGTGTDDLSSATARLGLAGAVLYCCECGFHPAHSRAMRFYESAQQLGVPVFFHNGGRLEPRAILGYAQPFLLDEVAGQFGDLKIVIGDMGRPFIEQTFAVIAKHPNVYADLRIHPNRVWQVYNVVMAAHERGVMDKLLFGSGFPAGSPGACMEALLGFNKLMADTSLPTVPRGSIRNIIERDTLEVLGLKGKPADA
jgi:predicted TIM-barrel fold metal-dependent hydrolase